MIGPALQWEIEQFLYREARLLDAGQFDAWLALFTDDVHYWVPTRETRDQREASIRQAGELSFFEDDKQFLVARVKRFATGLAHAEQPPSRTRHMVMNVEIVEEEPEALEVCSNIVVFQSRYEKSEHSFVGKREDRLRKIDREWQIARRKVVLDHTVLPRGFSIFF